jgi:ABC-type nitrate/sulfonate/bicarbonate transport system permease component
MPTAELPATRITVACEKQIRLPGRREIDPRRFRRRRRVEDALLAAGGPVALLALWQVAATRGWINAHYFPAPSTIWSTALDLIEAGLLWKELWATLTRIGLGLLYGVITGVGAGLIMGMFRRLRVALEPLLSAFYTVPKLAMLPLFLLIFGPGETPIVITSATTVFFFMWISTMAAVLGVEAGHRDAAMVFGAGRWAMFRHVLFPAALPQIFVALRVSTGVAVLVVVGTEFVQSSAGIGHLIWYSWSLFQADRMYVGIVVVALLGLVLSSIVKALARLTIRWTSLEGPPGGGAF